MMEVLQWCINVGFLGYLVWTWWGKDSNPELGNEAQNQEYLAQLERRIVEWETEFRKTQSLFEDKLKSIDTICEQANRILKSGRATQASFPPSLEEFELKEAMNNPNGLNEIPSLGFLANTKKRLQRESELDLKTLLKGQLA